MNVPDNTDFGNKYNGNNNKHNWETIQRSISGGLRK